MNVRGILRRPIVAGLAGGAAANFAASVSPVYGPGAALAIVGYVSKNPTLETMGGVSLGSALVGTTGIPGSARPSGGFL